MGSLVRFAALLLLALALISGGAYIWVQRTTRSWFERDVLLRTQLAVNGARSALIDHWDDPKSLRMRLLELTHDERVLAAAACSASFTSITQTDDFPSEFSCEKLGKILRASTSEATLATIATMPGGEVHIGAVPLYENDTKSGFVVVVHDLSFATRREQSLRRILILAFAVLSIAASAATVIAARVAWRGWSLELRKFLRIGGQARQFQPILRDVRELVEKLVAERESDGNGGRWTPQRLKNTLSLYLQGERILIVSNREPYIHEKKAGKIRVVRPASGLVTALEPVMRACSGVWIAHGSGSADREVVDSASRVAVPPGQDFYSLRRVWLSEEEERGYYYGFSNEGLWPLCHIADTRPIFRSEDWNHYKRANERFAEAVYSEVNSDDPIVLVQDYHLALAPRIIRERLPKATIISFWHIPWPNSERFGICPWRQEILEGMLGSSIMGFHTQFHCNNFMEAVDHYLEARIDREHNAIIQRGERSLVRPYPISIEWPMYWLNSLPSAAECRKSVLEQLKLPPNIRIGVGVDRLDYTKGVEERLLAVERLLQRFPEFRKQFVFIQLGAPSRTAIQKYRDLNETIEKTVERINLAFAEGDYRPIILLREYHEPETVFRYFRAADLCYVSSLHDGMNLVAKEFVAAREDERGVLLLSQFTGAARELTEALIVNPYDLDQASSALAVALKMSPEEQRDRIRSLRMFVAEFNIYRWAGRMLVDAARLRRRARLTDRLSERFSSPPDMT